MNLQPLSDTPARTPADTATTQPLPPRFTATPPADLVSLPAAAARFGYACAPYFLRHVAPRLGLAFTRGANGRYYTSGEHYNTALTRFLAGAPH